MQQKATEQSDEPGELTAAQQQVLAALLGGSTVTAAAEAVGIDRTTVHRWLRSDFDFQAALNRGRRELWDAVNARLHDAAQAAVEAVFAAVEDGDPRTAIDLLKGRVSRWRPSRDRPGHAPRPGGRSIPSSSRDRL